MTLFDAYLYGNHRVVNKWHNYFPVYEKHFERFRNRHVTLFEIGIGQGGSLQLWKGFLGPYARIVGGRLDQGPHGGIELALAARPEGQDRLPVGLQSRHVDGVEGGPAHESQNAHPA